MSRKIGNAQSRATFLRHPAVLSLPAVLLRKLPNVPTRASLAVETKGLFFLWLAYLNKKNDVSKQISSRIIALLDFMSAVQYMIISYITSFIDSFLTRKVEPTNDQLPTLVAS